MALNEMKDKAKSAINVENAAKMLIKAYDPKSSVHELRYEGDVCIEELFLKQEGYTTLIETNYKHNYRRYCLTEKGLDTAIKLQTKPSSGHIATGT